jgi:putative endonuclease
MAMHAKDELGKAGEQAAAEFLESTGYELLDRNWRCALGELDIVAKYRGRVFVVCEVKTRSGVTHGTPFEAVSTAKLKRLRQLAVTWLNAHGVRFEEVRIDVIGVRYEGTGGYTIEHMAGVA